MGNFVWASGSGGGKVGGSCKKFSGVERRAEGLVRLFRACDSAELREVASGSAMQGLWLRNKKVGSQVIGKDRTQFPGRGTDRFGICFGRKKKASCLPVSAMVMTDKAR